MTEYLDFDEVYAGDTSDDGKRIVIVLKRGGEDVHLTLPTAEVLRLLLATIAAQKLAVEKSGGSHRVLAAIAYESCTLQSDNKDLWRLVFRLPGGADLPLKASGTELRSLVMALSEALGLGQTPPESGSRH